MSEGVRRRPERPSVPPALYALVAAGGGAWAALAPSCCPEATSCVLGALILVAGVILALLWRRGGGRLVGACLACLALGYLAGAREACARDALAQALSSRPVSSCSFEVASDPSEGTYATRALGRVLVDGRPAGVVWLAGEGMGGRGSLVCGVGRFKALPDDDWGARSRLQGVAGTVTLVHVQERSRPGGVLGWALALREAVALSLRGAGEQAGAVLEGSVCGLSSPLREEGLDSLFSSVGLSHLVAVSGTHVSLVASLVGLALERSGRSPARRGVACALASGLLVFECGLPPSGVRAWLMALASLGAQAAGRRSHAPSAVCVVGLAMVLVEPALVGQLGFLLSVTCVLALSLFSPYASYALSVALALPRLPRRLPRRARRALSSALDSLRDTAAASLVAGVAALPLTLDAFGGVSLVGPLANALVGPLFTALLCMGMLAGALVGLPWLQAPLLWGAGVVGDLMLALMRLLARVPCGYVSLGVPAGAAGLASLVAAAALLASWPRISRRALALPLAACALLTAGALVGWRLFAPPRVVVLDVGQGDAILVQDGPAAALVDTGPDEAVAAALEACHVTRLDTVVLTHLHDDHVGGLASLAGRVPCDRVLVGQGVSEALDPVLAGTVASLTGGAAGELSRGDVVRVGRFELRVVSPAGPTAGDENGDSLVLALRFSGDGRSMTGLLTGDAEGDVLERLAQEGALADVDLLKVGHHGSAASTPAGAARLLAPEVAVASAGKDNRYGHPAEECVGTLEGVGALFLCTKDVGSVTVEPGEGGVRVRTGAV